MRTCSWNVSGGKKKKRKSTTLYTLGILVVSRRFRCGKNSTFLFFHNENLLANTRISTKMPTLPFDQMFDYTHVDNSANTTFSLTIFISSVESLHIDKRIMLISVKRSRSRDYYIIVLIIAFALSTANFVKNVQRNRLNVWTGIETVCEKDGPPRWLGVNHHKDNVVALRPTLTTASPRKKKKKKRFKTNSNGKKRITRIHLIRRFQWVKPNLTRS